MCLYCHTLVLPSWLCSVSAWAILRASGSLIMATVTASRIMKPASPKYGICTDEMRSASDALASTKISAAPKGGAMVVANELNA